MATIEISSDLAFGSEIFDLLKAEGFTVGVVGVNHFLKTFTCQITGEWKANGVVIPDSTLSQMTFVAMRDESHVWIKEIIIDGVTISKDEDFNL